MKTLLVYPSYPDTFWGFKHALRFVSKKAANPPLGLLTIAAMLPKEWSLKLVDMNVDTLKDKDIEWADCVFISAMIVQKESVKKVIEKCEKRNTKIVAGGPLFTSEYKTFPEVDHFILNEAEITLRPFLDDLQNGVLKKIYRSTEFPSIEKTPTPLWQLISMKKYANMNIQYSRGCPFNCEFCDITNLFGQKVRTKSKEQILQELTTLYSHGWRGGVFFVDDNFIGNKQKLKSEILPAIKDWMIEKKSPFNFSTEASINLADDEELMSLMTSSGFSTVFVGIETPHDESLVECGKFQNKNRDLVASVKKIQRFGIEVTGGFIVGFDNDTPSIFKRQIEFIQKCGIVTAMVGILNAPRNTRLYKRLQTEDRLLTAISGNNTDCSINFIPKMNTQVLIDGYKKIISTIYSPAHYYDRVRKFFKEYQPAKKLKFTLNFNYLGAFIKSIFRLGIIGKERIHYWKLLIWSFFKDPQLVPMAVTFAIYGFHFRKVLQINNNM